MDDGIESCEVGPLHIAKVDSARWNFNSAVAEGATFKQVIVQPNNMMARSAKKRRHDRTDVTFVSRHQHFHVALLRGTTICPVIRTRWPTLRFRREAQSMIM